jgi:hypothetical protein
MGTVVAVNFGRPEPDCLNCVQCAVAPAGTYCLVYHETLFFNEAPDCEEYDDGGS